MLPRRHAATPEGVVGCCSSGRRVLLDLVVFKRPGTPLEFCSVPPRAKHYPAQKVTSALTEKLCIYFVLKLTFKLAVKLLHKNHSSNVQIKFIIVVHFKLINIIFLPIPFELNVPSLINGTHTNLFCNIRNKTHEQELYKVASASMTE